MTRGFHNMRVDLCLASVQVLPVFAFQPCGDSLGTSRGKVFGNQHGQRARPDA